MKPDWFLPYTSSVGWFWYSAEYMREQPYWELLEQNLFLLLIFFVLGIPCGVDYLKQAPKKCNQPCWSLILNLQGLTCDFEGGDHRMPSQRPVLLHFMSWKEKICRKAASQKLQLEEVNPERVFRFLFLINMKKDVIRWIFPQWKDCKVRYENIPKRTNIAYLCLFNNSEWIPVDWAEIKDDTRFEHMDWRNIVYLVGYYKG